MTERSEHARSSSNAAAAKSPETSLMSVFDQWGMIFDLAALDLIMPPFDPGPHPAIEVFLVTSDG
jgi:hypothetical protein